jgi:hypothetical protein
MDPTNWGLLLGGLIGATAALIAGLLVAGLEGGRKALWRRVRGKPPQRDE